MFPISFILLLFIALPFLFLIVNYRISELAFVKLGIPKNLVFTIFALSLLGSLINIPLWSRKIKIKEKQLPFPFSVFFYYPPRVQEQTIAINFGGAVMPILISIYLLKFAPFIEVLIATLVITLLSKFLAKPVKGIGIAMPAFIPPLVSAVLAMLLSPHNAAPVAYISGTLGVLVGADLLNLNKLSKMGGYILSIGGAGVFDGIFLVGIISALLA